MKINLSWLKQWKFILIPTGVLCLGILGFLALIAIKPNAQPSPTKEQAWLVNAQTLKMGSYSPQVTLHGQVNAYQISKLQASFATTVSKLIAKPGDIVEKKTLLLAFDERDQQLILKQRTAEVHDLDSQIDSEKSAYQKDLQSLRHEEKIVLLTQQKVNRQEALLKKQFASEAALDEAKLELKRQELALVERKNRIHDFDFRLAQLKSRLHKAKALEKQAYIELSRAKVLSPYYGRVLRVHVAPGQLVRPGEALIELYNLETMEIRSQIPEKYVQPVYKAITAGKKVFGYAEVDGQIIRFQLDRFAGDVGQGRSGMDGYFRVMKGASFLTLGRTISFHLVLPKIQKVFAVPESAIYGHNRVYIIHKDRLKSIEVERLGSLKLNGHVKVLIRSAVIKSGERVLTSQLSNAIDGLKVSISDETVNG